MSGIDVRNAVRIRAKRIFGRRAEEAYITACFMMDEWRPIVKGSGMRCKSQIGGRLFGFSILIRGRGDSGQQCFEVGNQRTERIPMLRRNADGMVPFAEHKSLV